MQVRFSIDNFPGDKVFDCYRSRTHGRTDIDWIKVRLWGRMSRNEGLVRRILDQVSFAGKPKIFGSLRTNTSFGFEMPSLVGVSGVATNQSQERL